MKNLLTLVILLSALNLFAQKLPFEINGTIKAYGNSKFAYLYSKGEKDLFLRVPLVNGKFNFKGETDLDGELVKFGLLFVDARNNVTAGEVETKLKKGTWIPEGTAAIERLILEDITLEITESGQINYPKIVGGGVLNKQLKECTDTDPAKKVKLLDFVKKYPDSPVGVLQMQSAVRFLKIPQFNGFDKVFGSSREIYASFSDRLKQTRQVITLKKDIDLYYK